MSALTDYLWNKEAEFFSNFNYVSDGGITKINYDNLEWLLNKVKKPAIKICEIGCWTGKSTILFAQYAKELDGKVYAIDWFKGNPNTHLWIDAKYINIKNILIDNLTNLNLLKCVDIIVDTSINASKNFKDNYFDLVFLDGDHRYEAFKKDLDIWYPKVKKGGILCGHDAEIIVDDFNDLFDKVKDKDCSHLHLGIIKALSEFKHKAKLVDNNDVIWYIEKNA